MVRFLETVCNFALPRQNHRRFSIFITDSDKRFSFSSSDDFESARKIRDGRVNQCLNKRSPLAKFIPGFAKEVTQQVLLICLKRRHNSGIISFLVVGA
jgi:hypothetical protein